MDKKSQQVIDQLSAQASQLEKNGWLREARENRKTIQRIMKRQKKREEKE